MVFGSSGLVGGEVVKQLTNLEGPITIWPLYFSRNPDSYFEKNFSHNNEICDSLSVDIRNQHDVQAVIDHINPTCIWLPAAETNVDYCEEYPSESYATNVTGVKNVVDSKGTFTIIFFSTDYVFNGKNGPYHINNITDPINEYGKQKLIAENYILSNSKDYLIIRTCGVFGPALNEVNFVYRLIKNLKNNNEIRLPIDQWGTPTYSVNLIDFAIEKLFHRDRKLYHYANIKCLDRYTFGLGIAKYLNLDTSLIKAVETSELDQPARRPLRCGLAEANESFADYLQIIKYTMT